MLFAIAVLLFVMPSFAYETSVDENGETVITLRDEKITLKNGEDIPANARIIVYGNCTINEDSTISIKSNVDHTIVTYDGANLTINGGTFNCNGTAGKDAAVYVYTAGNSATINNGNFYGGNNGAYALRVCAGTMTVNGGTFGADVGVQTACCESTLTVNGGSWSSNGTALGQADILSACQNPGDSRMPGTVTVTGGTFTNFDPNKIYYSLNDGTITTVDALSDEYAYDSETGTVSCLHSNLNAFAEVPATTESTGTKAHYVCDNCGKIFLDESATQETDLASLTIGKLTTEVGSGDKNTNVEDEVGSVDTNTGSTSSSSSAAAASTASTASSEAKDETPKTGAISIVAVLAVVSIIGLAIIKRD